MNWETIEFYDEGKGTTDRLGNSEKLPLLIGVYDGQILPWNTEEILMLDKKITREHQKLMTDAPFNVIHSSKRIKIGEQWYTFLPVKKGNERWRIVHLKEYFV